MMPIKDKLIFTVFVLIIVGFISGYFYLGFNDISKLKQSGYRKGIISLINKGPRVITPLYINVWMAKSKWGMYKFRSMAAYVACRVSHNSSIKKQDEIINLVFDAFRNEPNQEIKREIIGWTTLATANVGLNCLLKMADTDDDMIKQRVFYLLSQIAKQEFYKDYSMVDKIFKEKGCIILTNIVNKWIVENKFPSRYVESNYSDIMAIYKYKEAVPILIAILKKQNNSETVQALREVTGQFILEDPEVYEDWWKKEQSKLKKAN